MTTLNCQVNQLTSLDLATNTALTSLDCQGNQLTSLDLATNTALASLICFNNQLTSLDVRNGNNTIITEFYSTGNPNLTCVLVDAANWSTTNWTDIDATSTFVNNETECTALSGYTLIPDANFEQALIDLGLDATIDGVVPTAAISELTSLDVDDKNIADLTGIKDFTALTSLICSRNQLTSLDVSTNTALTTLYCRSNQLTSLDVSTNTALTALDCRNNQLTSIDVSNNTALITLFCGENQLTSLDVSANTALTYLVCSTNQLTSLDVSNNTALTYLNCGDNHLATIDVSNNSVLTTLGCYLNQLTNVDVSANINLISLDCANTLITSLDVTNNTALTVLSCYNNIFTSLDVSTNTALTELWFHNSKLTSLDVRNGNNINFTVFNATNNPNLTCILVDDASYSRTNWTDIDATSTFVNNETECAALSIADNTLELGVSVYPNPTNSKLFIEGNETPISVSIYNVLGKEVISTKNTNNIDVKALPSGVYIIRISDGVRQTNRKFIKN